MMYGLKGMTLPSHEGDIYALAVVAALMLLFAAATRIRLKVKHA